MPKITFIRGEGALGRPLPNKDHVSAICMPFADANLPAGFGTGDRIKKVYSLGEAEALGILSSDANAAHTHYQVSEFYRQNPSGELYIYLYDADETVIANTIQPVIEFPQDGEIRQVALFHDDGLDTADVTALQAVVVAMRAEHRPCSVFVGFSAFDEDNAWGSAADLRALDCDAVSVVIGCDAEGAGGALASGTNNVPAIGAVLGAVSRSSVHQSIGWVDSFNFSDGTELEVPAVGNKADLVNSLSTTLQEALIAKGYIFFRKHIGITGSYASDSPTSALATSDYANIENVRVIDKAIRQARAALLPFLSSPLYIEQDTGLLREDTVAAFKAAVEKNLDKMEQDGEISGGVAVIDPSQPVLQTSKLVIGQKIVPVGVAREIEVKTEYALKLS